MIKELVQFTNSLDSEMRAIGMLPKEGLHISLSYENIDGELSISKDFQYEWFSKKKTDLSSFLKKSAGLSQLAWMVDTNKCIDNITRAIHSCSPYCLAIKRDNLNGGKNYDERKKAGKSLVYNNLDYYFKGAIKLLSDESERERVKVFRDALNSEEKMHFYLDKIPEYEKLKDAEYIVFYLDVEEEKYKAPNAKYLADKLFNTNDYNRTVGEIMYGTSAFFNGYPTKKPYLTHQSASFDISSRISADEARSLFDFQDIIGRNILPKPLPIFIHEDEFVQKNKRSLLESSIQLFRSAAQESKRIGYKEIIEDLYKDYGDQLGNYYLLFYDIVKGEGIIRDFDFVPKFEYLLKDKDGNYWKIEDLFGGKNQTTVKNVFQLQQAVLQPVFNNFLIVHTKSGGDQYKYFDELDAKFAKPASIYLLAIQYRKAFYDFIYKSKRQSVTQLIFNDILQTSILGDIRLDEFKNGYHTQERSIREKMNIWFSLSQNFDLNNIKPNTNMSSKLQEHREFIVKLTKGESTITSNDEYAFTVGQVIYYLLSKSKTADRSYKRLEPFMQQVQSKELNKAIARMFDSYKHENFSANFRNPFAEIMDYETTANVRDFMPTILAGIFSKNALFSDKEEKEEVEILSEPETTEE